MNRRSRYEAFLERNIKPTHPALLASDSERISLSSPTQNVSSYAKLLDRSRIVPSPKRAVAAALATSTGHVRTDLLSPEALDSYGLAVMASTVLDGARKPHINPASEHPGMYDEIYTTILDEIEAQVAEYDEGSEQTPRHAIVKPGHTNRAALSALFDTQSLRDELAQYSALLAGIGPDSDDAYIQETLSRIERAVKGVSLDIESISRPEASRTVKQVGKELSAIEELLRSWRSKYPNKLAYEIDNSPAFVDPTAGQCLPALIAQTHALAQRVFLGAGHRASGFSLRLMKIFGRSLMDGQPTKWQQNALDQIPHTIETVERRFNLDVTTVPYAVCPSCSCTYEPLNSPGSKIPLYPPKCTYRTAVFRPVCGAALLKDNGHPIKTFHYYSFFDWFGRFLSLPGIEKYGDSFCEEIINTPVTPLDKSFPSDGRFYRELLDSEGKLFVADRGSEGRWFFKLYADFFNIEGNLIGGQTASTGVMSVTCMNLPPEMREDPAFTFIPGIIQGLHEPNVKEAQHQHYLRPLVDELLIGYDRGVRCYGVHGRSGQYERVHKLALGPIVMDFRASRPYSGLSNITSRLYCIYCDVWHGFHVLRTDCEAWIKSSDERMREGARQWEAAGSSEQRSSILNLLGTRTSTLWRLPYYCPSLQLIVDPMHAFYLILLHKFFRVCLLGLHDDETEETGSTNQKKPPIAFRHEFTPPPPLSIINAETPTESSEQVPVVTWSHLSDSVNKRRIGRINCFIPMIASEPRLLSDIFTIQNYLSQSCPAELGVLEQKLLSNHSWKALFFVCNDLMVFPKEKFHALTFEEALPSQTLVKRVEMANALADWRINEIQEQGPFVWPHFTPKNVGPPLAPWAGPRRAIHSYENEGAQAFQHFSTDQERQRALQELGAVMNYNSAEGVGKAHRYLSQSLEGDTEQARTRLSELLSRCTSEALQYVCIDLNRLPAMRKPDKRSLARALIDWRMLKPRDPLKRVSVNSSMVLSRIHQSIREVIIPAWVHKPPFDVGKPRAGTLKAEHWRTLFAIHVPLALLSLWQEGSPILAPDAAHMGPVLETAMHLTCASTLMTKSHLTVSHREKFRYHLRQHIEGLKQNFPDFSLPTHHVAFHMYDFMDLFGNVRNWWCFPGERLIGKLRRIPINHKIGEFESTLLHSFCKGAAFRQWLMREDCPKALKLCGRLLDKAFGYVKNDGSPDTTATPDDSVEDFVAATPLRQSETPLDLIHELGPITDAHFLTTIQAPKGYYSIPSAPGAGNSYIGFYPNGERSMQWVAGQIHYIFTVNGITKLAVRRNLSLVPYGGDWDPFQAFWNDGFEAKMVSTLYAQSIEVVEPHWILGHTAIWKLNEEATVVLALQKD